MALLVVLAQDAAPRRTVAGSPAPYVRGVGATVGTALLGGLPTAGLAAAGLLRADGYGRASVPVFLTVTVVFAVGVVAAALIPHRELERGVAARRTLPRRAAPPGRNTARCGPARRTP